jgi:hypothetical protein
VVPVSRLEQLLGDSLAALNGQDVDASLPLTQVLDGDPLSTAVASLINLSRTWQEAGHGPDGAFVDVTGDRGVPTFPLHLGRALVMHVAKNRAYVGQTGDPLANYIRAGATIGVQGWKAALMRMGEKMHRLSNVAINPDNADGETVEDTAFDIAVIALLFLDLYRSNR